MAGKITHLEILTQVIRHLEHGSEENKQIAKLLKSEECFRYANTGTIAPDIFYYYHVLNPDKSKKAQIWGDLHHHTKVVELILSFLDLIQKTEEGLYRDRMLAFTLGYICHCAVDVVTHPYIFFISGDYYNDDVKVRTLAQYNHLRVEFALDTYLLDYRWGMSPKQYDFTQYINIFHSNTAKSKIDTTIWYFWLQALKMTFPEEFHGSYIGSEQKIIPGDMINDSYTGYVQLNSLFDSRSIFLRKFLRMVDRVSFIHLKASVLMLPLKENIDPRLMNEERRRWTYPADKSIVKNDTFINLVNKAAESAKELIILAWNYLKGDVRKESILDEYAGYNLDTGLRYQGIQEMKEFSPL
ncbi:MAG: zinc dependent phospholipase C family protein [Leptospiraceae bacterium]|nr:zinc dependent phospholipase C family protein [Leptospiraceae bacterium]MCP5502050.1 zinc dependent phospholipase C family protein [Leptospiraceae bacterium]